MTYPEVGLRQARSLRDEARRLIAQGTNPCTHRRHERHTHNLAEQKTLQAMYALWLARRGRVLKKGRQSTLEQIERVFDNDVLPALGKSSIYSIKRHDLLDVLARIERRRAYTVAKKVRTWFKQLFRFALVKAPGLELNPAWDLDVVAAPKPPVTHNPFLRLPELADLQRAITGYGGALQTRLGLRLLLLTGVRTGELRLSTPDEFDLKQGVWTIPPEVMKQLQLEMRKEGRRAQEIPPYIVPLSEQPKDIVRQLLQQLRPAQNYVFAHRYDLNDRMSENTLNTALHRIGYAGLLTGHGMRGALSTALHEIGYPKAWIDARFSHADPDKVSAAYNHAEYVEQCLRMMQDWADRLDLCLQWRRRTGSWPFIWMEQRVADAGGIDVHAHLPQVSATRNGGNCCARDGLGRCMNAQQVGRERRAGPGAGVAGLTGELAEGPAAKAADHVGVLEAQGWVFMAVASGVSSATVGVGGTEATHITPGVLSGIGVAGNHGIGDAVADLGRGTHLTAVGGAEQPVADADDAVGQAILRGS